MKNDSFTVRLSNFHLQLLASGQKESMSTEKRFLSGPAFGFGDTLAKYRGRLTETNRKLHLEPCFEFFDSLCDEEEGIITNGRKAEEYFLSIPNSESARNASRQYASKPHMAGTAGDFDTAKMFLKLLQNELGASVPSENPIYPAGSSKSRNATLSITDLKEPTAWIDVYYPIMTKPLDRRLEILDEISGQIVWTANLEEIPGELDEDAVKYANAVPAFHGMSHAGEAKGKLVYAKYGRPEDYETLISNGISLAGSIVLVEGAEQYGAAGVLIYTDPHDDGLVTVDYGYLPYPEGPARNPTSVERGSVSYITLYPGDATTPGYPSYENATRSDPETVPKIPSLPISWQNAQVILNETRYGGLNRTISLVNHAEDHVTPIWNVMGVIPGYVQDEVLVIGSHRDGNSHDSLAHIPLKILGAGDPSSGTASLHEVIRGFGELHRKGWKPFRTIVIASWDAEEFGLIGSTEWGEDFADWIGRHVVSYLNIDASVYGSQYRAHASPSLSHLVRSTANRIPHPTRPGRTLWDATRDKGDYGTEDETTVTEQLFKVPPEGIDSLGVYSLGTGTDFTVFVQHIGIASTNEDFIHGSSDSVYHYHSIFDTLRWQELYGDPTYEKHVAAAKHLGLQALSIADHFVLPLNTTHYAFELELYLDRAEILAKNLSLEVDFSSLRQSFHLLQHSSLRLDKEKEFVSQQLDALLTTSSSLPSHRTKTIHTIRHLFKRLRLINRKLCSFERGFIDVRGLNGRSWYRHLGVAPGKWLGYGATPLPAINDALAFERNATLALHEAERLQHLVDKLAQNIRL
ncbi:Zn-dependent exopeptidase [Abortiporus biennis]|nr:Zn-dependent exopeptidase [Abortiporus biennis]